jgi:putative CocE/NonD family hydrolase
LLDLGGVTVERDRPIAMRDGTVLVADIYRPADSGRYPVLLQRTPYNKSFAQTGVYQHPAWYARHGYVVIVQDTRGRFASEGTFEPYRHEARDGADTIAWATTLEGTTGKVATYGFSYAGSSQLLAAGESPCGLAAAAVGCSGSDFYDGWTYRGGALQLAFVISWTLQALAGPDALKRGDRDSARRIRSLAGNMRSCYERPLRDWLASSDLPDYVRQWIEHEVRDDYWRAFALSAAYDRITIPCLHIGGWYDTFLSGTIANYAALRCYDRAPQALLIGPWQHVPWARLNGAVDHGANADNTADDLQLTWFDHWLKGKPLGDLPRVRFFLMGADRWIEADEWPSDTTRSCELYLHSTGSAGSRLADGGLSPEPPGEEPPDIFVYDPGEPVCSIGGSSCCRADIAPVGSFDQRDVEIRNDVLVYTSAWLEKDCDVVGPVEVVLFAATDACDTDWTAKLVDLHPDGCAMNICDGILRARYRDSLERPVPVTPGKVHEYRISLVATAMRFAAGHAIRLEISSSNFPAYEVNPNTGRRAIDSDPLDARVATQVVFHDGGRPSRLRLSVAQGSCFPLPRRRA